MVLYRAGVTAAYRMLLFRYLREGEWATVLGYGLYVVFMAAGYYYNVTFVQLGLLDLGTRHVGLSRNAVSWWMAGLALLTVAVAIGVGVAFDRRGMGSNLIGKFRLLFGVVLVQVVLVAIAPHIRSVAGFGGWIVVAAVALGIGVPVSFGLTVDLIPAPDRGYVAAAITAAAYFAANLFPLDWRIETFSAAMLAAMVPGLVVLGWLASGRSGLTGSLSDQHERFGTGRFCHPTPVSLRSFTFLSLLALTFVVFFVDSLGFLRIIEEPVLVLSSWGSPAFGDHLFIAVVHVLGAIVAGVFYRNFHRRTIYLWVFGLFAFSHLLYTFDLRLAQLFPTISGGPSIINSGIYALAVSVYTTLNFALWPDLSTVESIGTHSAVGVGVSGWLATFLSTALALRLQDAEVGLLSHLNIVNALALSAFVGILLVWYGANARRYATGGESA